MNTDDVSPPAEPAPTRDEGLVDFYSAEADALLAQYRRVDFLLGPDTHDHVHSGTLCEVLLRDYLRRVLLPWMGIDKGFIYGRSEDGSSVETSEEIDILIHDQRDYRPIFRMDDFVIVQPEAVLGVVQVKKRLNTDGRNPLRLGLRNVVGAKRHVITQLRRNHADYQSLERTCQRLVSVVIGFDGRTTPRTYWRYLDEIFAEHASFSDTPIHGVPGRIFALPHFVGSLNGKICQRSSYSERTATYRCFASTHNGRNLAGQMVAHMFASLLWGEVYSSSRRPPFQYPADFEHESEHIVSVSPESETPS